MTAIEMGIFLVEIRYLEFAFKLFVRLEISFWDPSIVVCAEKENAVHHGLRRRPFDVIRGHVNLAGPG